MWTTLKGTEPGITLLATARSSAERSRSITQHQVWELVWRGRYSERLPAGWTAGTRSPERAGNSAALPASHSLGAGAEVKRGEATRLLTRGVHSGAQTLGQAVT